MRIVCPICEAAYEVEDRLLRPGRATRCARCEHRWVPLAAVEVVSDPLPEPPMEPEAPPVFAVPVGPTAMDRLSATSAPARGKLALRLAWAASVLVLLSAIAGLFAARAAIVAAWPPSMRLYSAFGVAPNAESPHREAEKKHEEANHGDETRQHPADRGH